MNPVTILASGDDYSGLTENNIYGHKSLICAKRGSGKSFLICSMIKRHFKTKTLSSFTFKRIVIFSPTELECPFYSEKLKSNIDVPVPVDIIYRLTNDILDQLILHPEPDTLFVIDDCVIRKDQNHYEKLLLFLQIPKTVIMSIQYPIFKPYDVKLFDNLIFGNECLSRSIKLIRNYIGTVCFNIDYSDLDRLFKEYTTNYGFLMVKNIKKLSNPSTLNPTQNNTPNDIISNENDQNNQNNQNDQNKSIYINGNLDRLSISQFDFGTACSNPQIFVCNASNTAIRNFVQKMISESGDYYTNLIVFTPHNSCLYEDMTDCIFSDPNLSMLKRLLIINKLYQKRRRELQEKGESVVNIPRILIIFDGVFGKGSRAMSDPIFSDVMFNARHRGISYILFDTYPIGIAPELRSNFDYVFLNAGFNAPIEKRLYDHYCGVFPDFKCFRQVYEQICTSSNEYLQISNRICSASFFDKVHWFRTDVEKPFIVQKFPVLPDLQDDMYNVSISTQKCKLEANLIEKIKSVHEKLDNIKSMFSEYVEMTDKIINADKMIKTNDDENDENDDEDDDDNDDNNSSDA